MEVDEANRLCKDSDVGCSLLGLCVIIKRDQFKYIDLWKAASDIGR